MLYYVLVSEICMIIDVLINKTELECLIKSGGISFLEGEGPHKPEIRGAAPTPNLRTTGEEGGGVW